MATITLKNIGKTYPGSDKAVISNLNLEIKDKEFVVLVGPSGCGKSTTLRMIAGLEDITVGEMYIDEKLVNHILPKDRDIAMVFQSYALYPHMTVYKNMAFALKLKKTPKEEIDKKVRWAADILGLTEYLNRKPKALSGGQRQRVALGRAMVRNPKVFLLDEPLSNLDAKLRNKMRVEIRKLHEKLATTFVYVTHDQVEAMTMGDRICVMNEGEIMQYDTPQNLYDKPANLFVAGFIGSPPMNFIPAKISKSDNDFYLEYFDRKVIIPKNKYAGINLSQYLKRELILGIRPEDLKLHNNDFASLRVQLDLIELMGSTVHLQVNTHGTDLIAVQETRINLNQENDLELYFDLQNIHLFDLESQEAIFN